MCRAASPARVLAAAAAEDALMAAALAALPAAIAAAAVAVAAAATPDAAAATVSAVIASVSSVSNGSDKSGAMDMVATSLEAAAAAAAAAPPAAPTHFVFFGLECEPVFLSREHVNVDSYTFS